MLTSGIHSAEVLAFKRFKVGCILLLFISTLGFPFYVNYIIGIRDPAAHVDLAERVSDGYGFFTLDELEALRSLSRSIEDRAGIEVLFVTAKTASIGTWGPEATQCFNRWSRGGLLGLSGVGRPLVVIEVPLYQRVNLRLSSSARAAGITPEGVLEYLVPDFGFHGATELAQRVIDIGLKRERRDQGLLATSAALMPLIFLVWTLLFAYRVLDGEQKSKFALILELSLALECSFRIVKSAQLDHRADGPLLPFWLFLVIIVWHAILTILMVLRAAPRKTIVPLAILALLGVRLLYSPALQLGLNDSQKITLAVVSFWFVPAIGYILRWLYSSMGMPSAYFARWSDVVPGLDRQLSRITGKPIAKASGVLAIVGWHVVNSSFLLPWWFVRSFVMSESEGA